MSFNRKAIKITITLNEEEYFFIEDTKLDSASIDGLACKVVLNFGNGALSPHGRISICNLDMAKINKLIRIKWNTSSALLNGVKVEVKEGISDYKIIYEGGINYAMVDFESAPDVWLHIETTMGQKQILEIDPPISYSAGRKVEDVIEELLKDTKYTFENNGVDMTANDMAYGGSRMAKINSICRDYEIDTYPQGNIFAICPKGVARDIKIPVVTPLNGMIGYPKPNMLGVDFTCLYSNALYFGGMVEIKDSIVEMANRKYIIYGLRMNLEANTPNGQWIIDVFGSNNGVAMR